ncbi:MAG: hypothetical protein H6Q66_645 [Firmicutes bacterium]|nr:hypothetical protein [Bacillota bacterium]
MNAMDDDDVIRAIKEKYSILDALREAGRDINREHKALCVFHCESNPSMHVYEAKNRVFCYSCNQGGDAINVFAAANGITNKEAVRLLVNRFGLGRRNKEANAVSDVVLRGVQPPDMVSYVYTDETGKPLFRSVRTCKQDGSKTFSMEQATEAGGWTKGVKNVRRVLYRLPDVLQAIKNGQTIFVAEGEKCADALAAVGLPSTTNANGAKKWQEADTECVPIGASIVILPDNDKIGREHAEQVAYKLHAKGCSVRIVRLPDLDQLTVKGLSGPDNKADVADWLAAEHTADELRLLAERTVLWEPTAEPDADLLDKLKEKLAGTGFAIEKGALCQVKVTQEGEQLVRLCNFVAWPVLEEALDDGDGQRRQYKFRCRLASGQSLPEVAVSSEELAALNWVVNKLGIHAIIQPGQGRKDQLRAAFQYLAQGIEERTVYTHTGWRKIAGRWAYLHAGGAIGAKCVAVDLMGSGESLQRYSLAAEGSFKEAADAAIEFMGVAVPKIAFSLFGAVALAPCREMLKKSVPLDFSLFLVGRTASGKSSMAALALNFFGEYDTTDFPANFRQTVNSLEKMAFTLKDSLLVVDDFYPAQTRRERENLKSAAQALSRAYGDGAARIRMRSDMSVRRGYTPRGLSICTGEEKPDIGESGQARVVFLDVTREDVFYDEKLQPLRRKKHLLRVWMQNYLVWLSDNWERLQSEAIDEYRALEEEMAGSIEGGRVRKATAKLLLGVKLGLQFMVERQCLAQGESSRLFEEAKLALMAVAEENIKGLAQEKPVEQFLAALHELIATKHVFVASKDTESLSNGAIGERDGDMLYLLPNTVFEAVQRHYAGMGLVFPVGQRTLWKQLASEGILEHDKDRNTLKRRMKMHDSKLMNVLALPVSAVFEE